MGDSFGQFNPVAFRGHAGNGAVGRAMSSIVWRFVAFGAMSSIVWPWVWVRNGAVAEPFKFVVY